MAKQSKQIDPGKEVLLNEIDGKIWLLWEWELHIKANLDLPGTIREFLDCFDREDFAAVKAEKLEALADVEIGDLMVALDRAIQSNGVHEIVFYAT
jgi:hypothetical protein